MKLTPEKIEEAVGTAKAQADELIEILLRQAIKDFEDADSDGFKLALVVKGVRAGRDATLTLSTDGQSCVELKHKDSTEAAVIDWGETLFDAALHYPKPPDDAIEGEAEEVPAAKQTLLPPERTGGDDGEAGEAAETAAKVKTITISSTSIFDSNSDPAQWPRLVSVRKDGAARVGEVVRIVMKNPDSGRRFDMGLYKCISAGPRDEYDRDAGRSEYMFDKLAVEVGPADRDDDWKDAEDAEESDGRLFPLPAEDESKTKKTIKSKTKGNRK